MTILMIQICRNMCGDVLEVPTLVLLEQVKLVVPRLLVKKLGLG